MLGRRRCCCDEEGTCDVTIHVVDNCTPSHLVLGASVSVWTNSGKTTLLGSGTTDSSGNVTIDVGSAGTYYYEVSDSFPCFATVSATAAFACGATINVSITVDTTNCCCPGESCCSDSSIYPKRQLYLTDGTGTLTSFQTTCGGVSWCTTAAGVANTWGWNGAACAAGTGTVPVRYSLVCIPGFPNTWRITRQWGVASGGKISDTSDVTCTAIGLIGPAHSCGIANEDSRATITAPANCKSFSWSGTLTPTAGNTTTDPIGGTVTIST